MEQTNNNEQMLDENHLITIRKEKLEELRKQGKDPFKITKYNRTHTSEQIKENYEELEGKDVTIAGRIMAKRVMGKASFCHIQDMQGRIQSYVSLNDLGEESYKEFKTYDIGKEVKITGLSANHDPQTAPQHLLFESNGKKMLYACDGAWMMTETFNYLRCKKLDAVIFDATVGDYEGDFRMAEHNSIPMIRLMIPSLKTKEIITDTTAIYLSHIAPRLHKSYAETSKIVKKDGFVVAFDGLKVDI